MAPVIVYRLVGRLFAPVIGAFAAVYWVFSQTVLFRVYKDGLETGIAAFLIVLLVYRLSHFETSWRKNPVTRRDLALLGILSALVIFSRLDLVFLAAFTGLWVVFRNSPIRYLMPLDIVSFAFSVLLAFVIKTGIPEYYELETVAVTTLSVSLLIKIPLAYFFGLYMRERITRLGSLFLTTALFVVASSTILGLVMVVLARMLSFTSIPRITLMYDAISTLILVLQVRLVVIGLKAADSDAEKASPIRYLLRNWKPLLLDGIVYYGVAFVPLLVYMIWNKFACKSATGHYCRTAFVCFYHQLRRLCKTSGIYTSCSRLHSPR